MANAIGVIGLTYRATDLQEASPGLFLELIRGLNEVAEVRGKDIVIPSLAGRFVGSRVADRLVIELRGFLYGVGATESVQRSNFRTRVKSLRTLFDPTLAPGALVASLEDATTATIQARTLNVVWAQLTPAIQRLDVELESVGPTWVIS